MAKQRSSQERLEIIKKQLVGKSTYTLPSLLKENKSPTFNLSTQANSRSTSNYHEMEFLKQDLTKIAILMTGALIIQFSLLFLLHQGSLIQFGIK